MSTHRAAGPARLRGRLSGRQQEVLDGILAGKPNRIIAQELILSIRTVEAHRAAIMSKVGVSSVVDLVRAMAPSFDGAESLDLVCRIYPGLVSFWDNGLIARFANDLHETAIGMSGEDIRGRHINEVLGASCYRQSTPFIHGVLDGQTQHFTQILRMPDGTPKAFCAVYAPRFDAAGEVEGFFAFMIETRAPSDDARLAEREADDEALWAEMILDQKSRILRVNETFTEITQYQANEVNGRTPVMIMPASVEPSAFMKFWGDIVDERRWQGTMWYRRRDGYLFRSRQRVTAKKEGRGQLCCRVMFSEIKIP